MFVSNQQVFTAMQSDIIYKRTLDKLRSDIEKHVCPKSGRASIKAFCEEYGFNRPNMVTVLTGNNDMSIALFVRITEALGRLVPGRIVIDAKQLDRVSLRGYLGVDYTAITETILTLHLETPPPEAAPTAEQAARTEEQ